MENEAVQQVRQGRSCAQVLHVGDGVYMLQATTQSKQASSRVRGVIHEVLSMFQFIVKLDDTGELIRMPRQGLYSEATQGGSVVAHALSGNSKQKAIKNESRSASTSPTSSAAGSDSAASTGRLSKRSRSDDENSSSSSGRLSDQSLHSDSASISSNISERAPPSRRARSLGADGISSTNGRCVRTTNASQHAAQQPMLASAAAAAADEATEEVGMAAPMPAAAAEAAANLAVDAAAAAAAAALAAAPLTAPYGIPLIKTRGVSITTHGARQELSAMLSALPAADSVSNTLALLWGPETNTVWKLLKVMESVSESGMLSAEQCNRLCYLQVALAQRKDFPAAAAASAAAASSGKLAAIRLVICLIIAYQACLRTAIT
jgi:hypothetical protein